MRRFTLPGLVLALVAVAPSAAFGATLVVDDSAQCKDAAFTSIDAASTAAAPGDTIKVCAGTYNETVHVDKPLTFLGAQAGKDARKDRTNEAKESVVTGVAGGFVLSNTANDVTIDGFTIRDAGTDGSTHRGIEAFTGSVGITVLNNVIEHNSGGVSLGNPTTDSHEVATFKHNRFDGNTVNPDNDTGIFACCTAANYVDIEENLFENHVGDNGGQATAINNSSPADSFWLVRNNDSIDDDTFFVTIEATGTAVLDNTITKKTRKGPGQSGSGILIGGDNNGVLVQDNTIKDGDARGIRVENVFGGPDTNVFIDDNNIDKRTNGIFVGGSENGVSVTDNQVTNATNDGFLVTGGAMNTFLKDNKAQSSANFDCEDQTLGSGTAGTASTWQNDKGKTSSPQGICKK